MFMYLIFTPGTKRELYIRQKDQNNNKLKWHHAFSINALKILIATSVTAIF